MYPKIGETGAHKKEMGGDSVTTHTQMISTESGEVGPDSCLKNCGDGGPGTSEPHQV